MTTAVVTPEITQSIKSRPVTFGRLVAVEARKFLDTRTGMWLMIAMLGGTIAMAVVGAALWKMFSESASVDMAFMASFVGLFVDILLPVMAILLVTSEWSQRTTLVTFALEPRRLRVLLAKLVVVLGMTIIAAVLLLGVSYLAVLAGNGIHGLDISTGLEWEWVVGGLSVRILSTLMAFGFAMALLNSPAAIVVYMGLPMVIQMVALIGPKVVEAMPWFSLTAATTPVAMGTIDTATEWAQLGTASLIWIVVPIVIGVIRIVRSEAK